MKRVILFICLAVWVLPLAAQIDFRESGFAKALEAAKVENKLVFMDCYTSWCGPCKRMAAQEFTQEKAGEYFNPRFIKSRTHRGILTCIAPLEQTAFDRFGSILIKIHDDLALKCRNKLFRGGHPLIAAIGKDLP